MTTWNGRRSYSVKTITRGQNANKKITSLHRYAFWDTLWNLTRICGNEVCPNYVFSRISLHAIHDKSREGRREGSRVKTVVCRSWGGNLSLPNDTFPDGNDTHKNVTHCSGHTRSITQLHINMHQNKHGGLNHCWYQTFFCQHFCTLPHYPFLLYDTVSSIQALVRQTVLG